MKYSSTVRRNVNIIIGFVIILLRFADSENVTSLCLNYHQYDPTFDYLWDGKDVKNDAFDIVCKTEENLHPEPWITDAWDYYKQAEYHFHLREIKLLSKPVLSADSNDMAVAKKFFQSCIKQTNGDHTEDRTIVNVLNHAVESNPIGPWGLLQKSYTYPGEVLNESRTWWRTLDDYYIEKFGLSTFHHFSKAVDKTDNKEFLILSPPESLIPARTLLAMGPAVIKDSNSANKLTERSKIRQAYVNYIHNETLKKLYPKYKINSRGLSAENQINMIENMIDFEINLAEIALPARDEDSPESLAIPIKLSKWQEWYNRQFLFHDVAVNRWKESPILYLARGLISNITPCKLNWKARIETLLKKLGILEEYDYTTERIRVHIQNKPYHLKLCALLSNTDAETIVNYIHWNNLRNGLIRTDEGNRKFLASAIEMNIIKDFRNTSERERYRAVYCVKENIVKTPVYRELMQHERGKFNSMKRKIRAIYDNIMESVLNLNIERDFYNYSKIATDSKEKLYSMPINLFGDESWLDYGKTDDEYPREKLDQLKSYFRLHTELRKMRIKSALRLFNEPVSYTSWPVTPDRPVVFAMKRNGSWELFCTAAILQKPFFELDKTDLMNYAGLGVEIAMTIWNVAVFPNIKPSTIGLREYINAVNYYDPIRWNITDVLYHEVNKDILQTLEGLQIALNAYAYAGRLDDTGRHGRFLEPQQKSTFVAAYMKTQCEKMERDNPMWKTHRSSVGTWPGFDTIGARYAGAYYPIREFVRNKLRIDRISQSGFYAETFQYPYK